MKIFSIGTYIGIFVLGIAQIPIINYFELNPWFYLLAPIGIWGFFGFVIPTLWGYLEDMGFGRIGG